jgi:hypothetical protein
MKETDTIYSLIISLNEVKRDYIERYRKDER